MATIYKNKYIGQIAAIASLIGLSGTAFFEAEFTGDIITSTFKWDILEFNVINIKFNFLFIFFVFVALWYIWRGGLKAVIATDKFQLKFGFIAFNLFVIYTYIKVFQNGYYWTSSILFVLSFLSVLLLNVLYPKFKKLFPNSFAHTSSSTLIISLFSYVIAGSYLVFGADYSISSDDTFNIFLTEQKVSDIFSLGTLSLISLLLANGLWQIVDISSWQRLSSLNQGIKKDEISKALSFISIYSPTTWLIAIFFGMGLRYVGTDVTDAWNALKEFTYLSITNGSAFDISFIFILMISMVFIMFSTLDSLISSISFTSFFDIIPKGESQGNSDLKKARNWTIFYTIFFMTLYVVIRQKVSAIDSILYTFYSFQLALFPSIMAVFILKKINPIAAITSIIGGTLLTLIPLFLNTETINPYSASAIFSVIGSTSIYLIISKIFPKYNMENAK